MSKNLMRDEGLGMSEKLLRDERISLLIFSSLNSHLSSFFFILSSLIGFGENI
jgi:hypothetical protein